MNNETMNTDSQGIYIISYILAWVACEITVGGGVEQIILIPLSIGIMLVIELGIFLVKRKKKSFRASCYSYGDRLLLCANCLNEAEFYYRSEPYRLLFKEGSDSILGEALIEVLEASDRVVPLMSAEERKDVSKEFLLAAEITSERKLQQTAVCCSVTCDDDKLCFEPEHNGGTNGDNKGFSKLPDSLALILSRNDSTEEIGKTLREALARSTSYFTSQNPN